MAFKKDKISGEAFMEQRKSLLDAKKALEDEIHRMGA